MEVLKQTSPVVVLSNPNPWPLKKMPFSKTKTPVGLTLLRLSFIEWVKKFRFSWTSYNKKKL